MPYESLALLEIGNLVPALVVADRCAKAAGVRIVGMESTMGAEQCIKLAGPAGDVREAGDEGVRLARRMGTRADLVVMAGPTDATRHQVAAGDRPHLPAVWLRVPSW